MPNEDLINQIHYELNKPLRPLHNNMPNNVPNYDYPTQDELDLNESLNQNQINMPNGRYTNMSGIGGALSKVGSAFGKLGKGAGNLLSKLGTGTTHFAPGALGAAAVGIPAGYALYKYLKNNNVIGNQYRALKKAHPDPIFNSMGKLSKPKAPPMNDGGVRQLQAPISPIDSRKRTFNKI